MTRKCYKYTMQTNQRHREEKAQSTNCHKTAGRRINKSTQLSLPLRNVVKLERILIMYCITKTPQTMRATIINESTKQCRKRCKYKISIICILLQFFQRNSFAFNSSPNQTKFITKPHQHFSYMQNICENSHQIVHYLWPDHSRNRRH